MKNIGLSWKKLHFVAKILITLFAIIIIVLNLQPFTDLGYGIGEEIVNIPLVDSISSFPIVGSFVGGFIDGLLRWFLFNRGDLISLTLWAGINYLELLHLFFDGSLWLSIGAYTIELVIHLFKYEIYGRGHEDFFQDFGFWTLSRWNIPQLVIMFISIMGTEYGLGALKNMWLGKNYPE